jgi:hypothetical protein
MIPRNFVPIPVQRRVKWRVPGETHFRDGFYRNRD